MPTAVRAVVSVAVRAISDAFPPVAVTPLIALAAFVVIAGSVVTVVVVVIPVLRGCYLR
jgi:hypothetical protein